MSRNRNFDIAVEMFELIDELCKELRQDLVYFRASVYKTEAAGAMGNKIEKLRFLADIFPDPALLDAFDDFDAEARDALAYYVPGECSYTARTTRLLSGLEAQMNELRATAARSRFDHMQGADNLTSRVRRCRSELLEICRHGSAHWNFFQGI